MQIEAKQAYKKTTKDCIVTQDMGENMQFLSPQLPAERQRTQHFLADFIHEDNLY